MSQVLVTESYLSNIASAIRSKNGLSSAYTPSQMASAINSIVSAGALSIVSKTISSNGTYSASAEGVDAFSMVVVDIAGEILPSAEGVLFGTSSPTPSSSASIPAEAYMNDSTITSFYDSSVTAIGARAFKSCPNLLQVDFPACETVGEDAFNSCPSLISVSFPVCKTLNEGAFEHCISLTSVSFPDCEAIGSNAFHACTSLADLYIPNVSIVYDYAFMGCSLSLDMPELITASSSAFYEFYGSAVSVPKLSVIGAGAFKECTNLETISLPLVQEIGAQAFYSCSKLSSVYLMGSSVPIVFAQNTFYSTPILDSSYLGYFGSIYIPSSMYSAYRDYPWPGSWWTTYSDRIVSI